jgi:hypothetical protein
MSSWATRNIPKKRDLSKIPEAFRPAIISRAEQPLVIQSESFRPAPKNEVIVPTTKGGDKAAPVVNPRQFIPKKIESAPAAAAFELTYSNKSYVFVILRNIRNTRDNDLWISSYNSIRKFYTNKIIIIDDNSSINTVDGKLTNTEILKSEFNGAGEILPYYYYLKYKWADRMVFLHDSMFLNRPFRDSELEGDIKFHWYFDTKDNTDYRKISNYISLLKNNKEMQAYITDISTQWYGCFGATSICDLKTIEYLEEEYNIFKNLVLNIKTRKDREAFERVFGIILYYEGIFTDNNCSNFGNILKYPGAFESDNTGYETAVNILRQRGYDTAIMKVWRGR